MSRLSRLQVYVREMSPPQVVLIVGLLKFAVVYFTLQALSHAGRLSLPPRAFIGGVTLGLVLLLLRVYDELKDVESDRRLGEAGDARYATRPVVRGAVLVSDVRFLGHLLTALLFVINLAAWHWIHVLGFLLLFAVLWLSSVWFFWPRIAQSLLLALLTHNPLTLLSGLYVVAVFASDWPLSSLDACGAALVLLGTWLPVTAWETSRKVRIPEDETDYVTYSKLWGWQTAALVPLGFVLIASGLLAALALRLDLPGWYLAGLAAATAIPAAACLAFRFAPSTKRSKLQPFTEAYAGLSDVLLIAALVATRGVSL